jgi:hypothetical protein
MIKSSEVLMRSVRTLAALITVYVSLLFAASGCGEHPQTGEPISTGNDRIVVSVGPREITADRLVPVFQPLQGDSLMVEERLESIVNRLLILQDAVDRGLDSTEAYVAYVRSLQDEKLKNEWFENILNSEVNVPEDSVTAYYGRMGDMVTYTAISLMDSSFADSLRKLVIEGADMNLFAQDYSINGFEARMQGRLGPVDILRTRSSDRELLRDLLPGQVSGIASTQSGYRFVRLDSSYHEDPPPLEDIRSQIENVYLADLRNAYGDYLMDSLRTELGLELNTDAIELVADHYSPDSSGCIPFTGQELGMEVYSFNGGDCSVDRFVEKIDEIPRIPEYQIWNPQWLAEYAEILATTDIMVMKAMEAGMDTLPEIRDYLATTADNHLLDVYHEEVIEPRLTVSEEALLQEYENRKDTLLIEESRIFEAVSAEGAEQLQILSDKLQSGEDPFDTPEVFTPATGLLAPGESLITLPIKASQVPQPFDGIIFGAGMNETVTCSLSADQVLVLRPIEVIPARTATLDEVRDRLEMDLRVMKEEEVVSGLVDSLASVYHIEIDRDFIEGFMTPAADAGDGS